MGEEKAIVTEFSEKMYGKVQLRHNRYAPLGWKTMDVKRLITLLKGELAELEESLLEGNRGDAAEEAIDIANYAMFLHEVLHDSTR